MCCYGNDCFVAQEKLRYQADARCAHRPVEPRRSAVTLLRTRKIGAHLRTHTSMGLLMLRCGPLQAQSTIPTDNLVGDGRAERRSAFASRERSGPTMSLAATEARNSWSSCPPAIASRPQKAPNAFAPLSPSLPFPDRRLGNLAHRQSSAPPLPPDAAQAEYRTALARRPRSLPGQERRTQLHCGENVVPGRARRNRLNHGG